MKSVSVTWLMSHGACLSQVALFRTTFGKEAEITRAGLEKAAKAGLDLGWLAGKMIAGARLEEYYCIEVKAAAERDHKTSALWEAYRKMALEADAEYMRIAGTMADKERDKAIGKLERTAMSRLEKYRRVTAEAAAKCGRVTAEALADALGLPPEKETK